MKLAFIKWSDACFKESGWYDRGEIDSGQAFANESAGFLVKDDARGVVLALEHNPEDGKFRSLLFIPRAMVKSKRVFKL